MLSHRHVHVLCNYPRCLHTDAEHAEPCSSQCKRIIQYDMLCACVYKEYDMRTNTYVLHVIRMLYIAVLAFLGFYPCLCCLYVCDCQCLFLSRLHSVASARAILNNNNSVFETSYSQLVLAATSISWTARRRERRSPCARVHVSHLLLYKYIDVVRILPLRCLAVSHSRLLPRSLYWVKNTNKFVCKFSVHTPHRLNRLLRQYTIFFAARMPLQLAACCVSERDFLKTPLNWGRLAHSHSQRKYLSVITVYIEIHLKLKLFLLSVVGSQRKMLWEWAHRSVLCGKITHTTWNI